MLSYLHKKISTYASLSSSQALIENLWLSSQWKLKYLHINSKCNGWPEFNLILNTGEQCLFTVNLYNKQSPELELNEELPEIGAKLGCGWISCMYKTKLSFCKLSQDKMLILIICRREVHFKSSISFPFGSCQRQILLAKAKMLLSLQCTAYFLFGKWIFLLKTFKTFCRTKRKGLVLSRAIQTAAD